MQPLTLPYIGMYDTLICGCNWKARYTDLWFAIGRHDKLTCGLQFISNFIHLQPLTLPYIGMHNTLTCGLQFMTSAKPIQLAHWHCKHCGATNHYPDNYPFRPNHSPTITGGQRAVTRGKSNSRSYMAPHPNQPPKTNYNHWWRKGCY